ncbi:hypothetical protein [Oceanobacillus halophilus]|uniref:Uncharacterized protein n=1 Tax=Oceanobacillus halophilus TaxID=930130 RepID=A0A494ZVZ4_9BACI|nr:hypothetical protein [Oceanobacillus halophilus]RKQ30751.1 hypothetical protein D8M06_15145 [Oceanobacillus halophilus]
MSEKTKKEKINSLISISPKLYRYITSELQKRYHVHSYDLQAGAIKKEHGIHVFLRFGERFSHEKEQFFSDEKLEDGKELDAFIEEAGEACKQVLIDDYFKRMTP